MGAKSQNHATISFKECSNKPSDRLKQWLKGIFVFLKKLCTIPDINCKARQFHFWPWTFWISVHFFCGFTAIQMVARQQESTEELLEAFILTMPTLPSLNTEKEKENDRGIQSQKEYFLSSPCRTNSRPINLRSVLLPVSSCEICEISWQAHAGSDTHQHSWWD